MRVDVRIVKTKVLRMLHCAPIACLLWLACDRAPYGVISFTLPVCNVLHIKGLQVLDIVADGVAVCFRLSYLFCF